MEAARGHSLASIVTLLNLQRKMEEEAVEHDRPPPLDNDPFYPLRESPVQLRADDIQVVEVILEAECAAVVGIERQ